MTVSTTILPHEDARCVADSLLNIFPTLDHPSLTAKEFPVEEQTTWEFTEVDLDHFVELISQQRILDTALDAMAAEISDDCTTFSLSRQASLAGKVAFVLRGERPLGGSIHVTLKMRNLAEWIENVTWHEGRKDFPRMVRDDLAMRRDGEVRDWIA